jgi:hypothetical protein
MTDIVACNIDYKINELINEQYTDNVKKRKQCKKKSKVTDEEFRILSMSEYDLVNTIPFNISQLKVICGFYKIKKNGNKSELIKRIHTHLKYSLFVIKIQSLTRGHLLRRYIHLAGPALYNRTQCVNDTDFATLEPINEIQNNQFFSFLDSNKNIYGCDITSMFGLLCKSSKNVIRPNKIPLNPYTREPIDSYIIVNFNRYLCLAKANNIKHIVEEEEEFIDPTKQLEMKIIELFQYINELGNYADSTWFTNLSRHMVVLFIREVYDIWNYRAQLTQQMMIDIVPPHGNPFSGLNLQLVQPQPIENLQNQAIKIIELLVKSGYALENRSLGAYYVLAALTLVSDDARNALPWLFQSVAH